MLCRDSRNRERKDEEAEGAKAQPITAQAFGLRSFPCGLKLPALDHHQTSFLRSITSATEQYISQFESPASPKTPIKTTYINKHASPVPRSRLCAQAPLCPYSSVSLCASAACPGSPGQHRRSASCQPARSSSCCRRSSTGCTRSERR